MTSSNGGDLWDWRAAMPELASISSQIQTQPQIKTEEFTDHYKVIAKFPGSVRDNIRVQIHDKTMLLSTSITPHQLTAKNKPHLHSALRSSDKVSHRSIEHKVEFAQRVSSKLVHRHFQNGVLILILAKR